MSSRKTVQAPFDRKEFFGHGAPRSPLISTAEDLPGGAEPSSADRRLASKRPVSKLVTALQPSSGWVETGPVAPSRTRIGTASAARDSAVSKSVGRSQAQVFGPPKSPASAAPISPGAVAKKSKSILKPSALGGSTAPKSAKLLNKNAPAFYPVGVRIPVHLAPDCEWTDEQILAADDLRRAQTPPDQFYSTGSASTKVPSYIPRHRSDVAAVVESPEQLAAQAQEIESASSRSSSEVAPKKRAASKKPRKQKKPSAEAALADTEAPEPLSKRPKVLWKRSSEKPDSVKPAVRAKSTTFQNFRRVKPDAQVPMSNQSESSPEVVRVDDSSSDDENHKRSLETYAESTKTLRTQSPQPLEDDHLQAADMLPILVALVVRPPAADGFVGQCMFES